MGEHTLLRWIAPTGVAPDLGFRAQSFDRVVKHLEHECGIDNVVHDPAGCQQMNLRFLHLDNWTAGVGQVVQLRIERIADGHDPRRYVFVVLILHGEGNQLGRDGSEFHRFSGQALGCLP